jgi:hypothetical protein
MTSHLDEGRIQELVDGEIPSSELLPIQAHLAVCAECRARLDEARAIAGEADRLIETIELPEAPVRTVPRIPTAGPRAWMRNLAWAATLVVAAGLGYVARNPSGVTTLPENKAGAPVAAKDLAPSPAETVAAVQPQAAPPTPSRRPAESRHGTPAGRLAQERDKDSAGASQPAPSVAKTEREEAKVALRERLQSPSPTANSDSLQKKAAQSLADSPPKLEAGTTSAASDSRAAPRARAANRSPATAVRALQAESVRVNPNRFDELAIQGAAAKSARAPIEITVGEAQQRLDGALRLIGGLVPVRIELLGADVRVVYSLESGELLLQERLENGNVTIRLTAPPGFPSDSLDRLRARVHD